MTGVQTCALPISEDVSASNFFDGLTNKRIFYNSLTQQNAPEAKSAYIKAKEVFAEKREMVRDRKSVV